MIQDLRRSPHSCHIFGTLASFVGLRHFLKLTISRGFRVAVECKGLSYLNTVLGHICVLLNRDQKRDKIAESSDLFTPQSLSEPLYERTLTCKTSYDPRNPYMKPYDTL